MWKFRRGFKLLNFTYSVYLGRTHVGKLTNLRLIPENLKFPCFFRHPTQLFCSSSLSYSNHTAVTDEMECGKHGNQSDKKDDDDDFETRSLGLKDEKLNHQVGTFLEILRGCSKHGNESDKDKEVCDKAGVVNGLEVENKLKQCGIIPTPEVVIEVLERTRDVCELAFMFFLWVGKQPGYAYSVREYHSMIFTLAKMKQFDSAWTLIDEMRKKGIVNRNTLLIMIRKYSAAHDVVNAVNTFHDFKRFDFQIRMEDFHNLLSALTRYKNVKKAEHLLFTNSNTFQFNTKSFNIILNGWCNIVGSPLHGVRFWGLMINQGIQLDVFSYSCIISLYLKRNKAKEVIRLFYEMKEKGLQPDSKVYNAFMDALAKEGRATEAMSHLRLMAEDGIAPDSETFHSLIKPLCIVNDGDGAQILYDEMLRRGVMPAIKTFHVLLGIQRTEEDIFMLLDKMKELSCHPNKETYILMIKIFLSWRKLDTVLMLWDQMKENGWNDDRSPYIILLRGLFLNGKLEEALQIYSEMKAKSLLPDAKTDKLIRSWLSGNQMFMSQKQTCE